MTALAIQNPLCLLAGCGKPTWNSLPNEYCGTRCQQRAKAQLYPPSLKPESVASTGVTPNLASVEVAAPPPIPMAGFSTQQSTLQIEGPLCFIAGCGKPTWNGLPNEYCSSKCQQEAPRTDPVGTGAQMRQLWSHDPFCGTESPWHRFARKQLEQMQVQLDMVKSRLEDDGVLEAELKEHASRAVGNYAHFHNMKPGSTDITACPCGTDGANILNVVLSCAGLRGWATAEVRLPEMIVTIHASSRDASGRAEIMCTNLAGNTTIVEIASNTKVAEFYAALADKLHVRADLLRLILPNSRLLEESDDGKAILDVLDKCVLDLGSESVLK